MAVPGVRARAEGFQVLVQGLEPRAQAGPLRVEQVALLHHAVEALQQLSDPVPPSDVTRRPPGPGRGEGRGLGSEEALTWSWHTAGSRTRPAGRLGTATA